MKDKKILYVSSEVVPYLPETETSKTSFGVAKKMHNSGVQTRIFMPRFGVINERRHQLHEVIRLSGMNLIINDMDMPLIIKVASIPKERMQVYFIDNEEYFKRKFTYADKKGKLFPDNDERAIFFAKGVIETVKKLNWAPDIIHVHGWMASLLPLYIKEYYKNDPLFADSKIVTSIYNSKLKGKLDAKIVEKLKFDKIADTKLTVLSETNYDSLLKIAIENSDAIVKGSEDISEDVLNHIEKLKLPTLAYQIEENYKEKYTEFYLSQVLKN